MKRHDRINRIVYAGLILMVAIAACRPAKKVQKLGNVITTKDTASTVTNPATSVVDSAAIIRNVVSKLDSQRINFKTFNAKVKMDYDGSEGNGQATVYVRMQKDSIIWLSLTGALGIEGFRVIITKDSVKLMNKLDKVVQFRSIQYLKDLTHVPINFYDMQNILVGNPIYLDSNIVSYKFSDDYISLLMAGSVFKNLLTLDKNTLLMQHSKLDDIDPGKNRTADITFSNYDKVNNFNFSTARRISVAEKAKLDINLEFKQYNFDQPQTFPFNIPKNYKSK